jgi:hypothetical protein
MIRFEPGVKKVEALGRCILKGKDAAGRITKELFIRPINLEYEKTFHPFLLCSKKRYAGLYFEEADSEPYVAAKGLDLVRRDRIPLARELQREILDMVLWHKDLHGAVQRIRQVASDLLGGKVALELLVLSKQLKGKYVNDQPHLTVARKIQVRMPGSEPQPGDRVPYVFLDIGDPKAKASEMAEDPKYAADNGLKLAYLYYLEHCLMTPLATILDAFVTRGNAKTILFADLIRDHKVKLAGNKQITSFFLKKDPEPGAKKAKPSPFMSIGIQDVPKLEAVEALGAVHASKKMAEVIEITCDEDGRCQQALNASVESEEERLGSGPWTKEELLKFSDAELSSKSGAFDIDMAKILRHTEEWSIMRVCKQSLVGEMRRRFQLTP